MIEQSALITALFEHAMNMSLGLKVVLPRESYQPTKDETFLDVSWLPNETVAQFVGHDTPDWYQGFLQVAVMTPENTSLVDASSVADEVISYWTKGTVIDGGGFRIKINRSPWPAPSFKDESWDRLPISIPYQIMA